MADRVSIASPERRKWEPCGLHEFIVKKIEEDFERGEKRMDRFEEKIDQLLNGQANQALLIESLQRSIEETNKSVALTNNGYSALSSKIEKVCTVYDEKMKEYDEFSWFRKWANKMKESVITKILTITFAGGFCVGAIIFVIHAIQVLKKM